MEFLSRGWRGEARELQELTIKLQASPKDLEEKACPNCKSIAVEKINPRRPTKLLWDQGSPIKIKSIPVDNIPHCITLINVLIDAATLQIKLIAE